MKNLVLTLIITLPLTLLGQGWEQTLWPGYEIGHSVKQTNDGGYIVTGSTSGSFTGGNLYLVKTDGNGNEQWYKTFGGTTGKSVKQTSDGGYIIENTWGIGPPDIVLVKTDWNGNEQWYKTFVGTGGEDGESVQQTSDGGYIIGGYTNSFGNGEDDFYLIKTDVNGNEQWSRTFGGIEDDNCYSVQQTSDGGYIMTGVTNSFGNGNTVYLVKTDGSGNEQWSKTFDESWDDYGFSVQQTNDGGYVITGWTYFGNGYFDVFLIKTDGNGNEQWNKTFGGIENDYGNSVKQTNDGGYILCGTTISFGIDETEDVYLIKTDGSGNEMWSQTYGGVDEDQGWSVDVTLDGGYIISGTTESFSIVNGDGIEDIYLIKTDSQGNITSTFEIPLPNPNRKLEKTVNLIGQEIKPQTNTPIIEIFDDGSVEKKLIIEK